MDKVFVYGTLKKSNEIRGLDKITGCEFINEAQTIDKTYNMIDLGYFPAVLCQGSYNIKGEVWNVDQDALHALDIIEGYPDFYSRKKINTTEGVAWIYYFKEDTKKHNYIMPKGEILEW